MCDRFQKIPVQIITVNAGSDGDASATYIDGRLSLISHALQFRFAKIEVPRAAPDQRNGILRAVMRVGLLKLSPHGFLQLESLTKQ